MGVALSKMPLKLQVSSFLTAPLPPSSHPKKTRHIPATNQSLYTQSPLFILVNEHSASASEIIAGAIQDHQRGKIIGTPTYGKASIQRLRPLKRGGALILTIGKYLTPNGSDISDSGIIPDIRIPIPAIIQDDIHSPDFKYEYSTDYQLQRALDIALLDTSQS